MRSIFCFVGQGRQGRIIGFSLFLSPRSSLFRLSFPLSLFPHIFLFTFSRLFLLPLLYTSPRQNGTDTGGRRERRGGKEEGKERRRFFVPLLTSRVCLFRIFRLSLPFAQKKEIQRERRKILCHHPLVWKLKVMLSFEVTESFAHA